MESEALNTILKTHAAALSIDVTDQAAVLPDDVELHDLEKFHPTRRRPQGRFQTTSISNFAKFVADFGHQDNSVVFINTEELLAKCIIDAFDGEDQLHCEFNALHFPQKTAAFLAITNIINERKKQRETAEWMEDWAAHIVPLNQKGEPYPIGQCISAIRCIDVEQLRTMGNEEQSLRTERTALERTSISSVEQLPSAILFTCTPFSEMSPREIKLRVSFIAGDGTPKVVLTWPLEDQEMENIAEEYQQLIEKHLPQNIKTYIGSF